MRTCFTGHRKINDSYNIFSKEWEKVAISLNGEIENLISKGCVEFISGAALGTDTLAFLAVQSLKPKYPNIKNKLAIPFKGHDEMWMKENRELLKRMIELADEVIIVSDIKEYFRAYNVAQLQKRNEYMVDNSDVVIAVWDGRPSGGTTNCLNYANKVNRKIIEINTQGEVWRSL